MMNTKLTKAAGVGNLECISGSLNIFAKPYMDVGTETSYYTEVFPTNAITQTSNVIQFDITPSSDFISLQDSFIHLKVKITKEDGTDIDAFIHTPAAGQTPASGNSIGFIQAPLLTLFNSVDVSLNGHLLSDSYSTYGINAYLQLMLNFSPPSMNSRLALFGFYHDTNTKLNRADANGTASGFKTRAQLTARSSVATFLGPIFHPLFNQDRWLIPLLNLGLTFKKSTPTWVLKGEGTENFQYKIESMKVVVKKVKVRSEETLKIERELTRAHAAYPIRHSSVKPFHIEASCKQISFANCFGGRPIPQFAALVLVDQAHYRGQFSSSPLTFGHYNLETLKISFDGITYPTPNGYILNYSDTSFSHLEPYANLFNGGKLKEDYGLGISLASFKEGGFAIYTFNFGAMNSVALDHTSIKKHATARLDLTFAQTPNNPSLTALLYQESDETIYISSSRQVIRDYFL